MKTSVGYVDANRLESCREAWKRCVDTLNVKKYQIHQLMDFRKNS